MPLHSNTNHHKPRHTVLKYSGKLRGMEIDVERLTELRIDAGLSQSELARRAGLSQGAVGNIERRGSGRPESLKKIADVLGVRASMLAKPRR